MRDDFLLSVKHTLGLRVNYLCSNPDCRIATAGPHSDPEKSVNKGVAAHITAASSGGERFEVSLTPEQRSSANNGIWLCQNCAKLIDSDEEIFSVETLRNWKVTAESQVKQSIESNSPLTPTTIETDVRINVSYAGGEHGTHAHINIFNASPSPVYLSAWYAKWGDEKSGSLSESLICVRNKLPHRLQGQDRYDIVVDLGECGYTDLRMLGVIDGSNRFLKPSETEIAIMLQHAKRYSVLYPPRDTQEDEAKLRQCEVEVKAQLETVLTDRKSLAITFTNKSEIPIQLHGAEIDWKYDPPRMLPRAPDAKSTAQEISGSVGLACRSDLSSPVLPANAVVFYVHESMVGVLVELLLGDVKDDDITIFFRTDTRLSWTAKGDEIPGTIREYAQHFVDSRKKKGR